MTDIALTEWEHQPHVLNVLTSREMGAWLERRDSRILQEIRQEIADFEEEVFHEPNTDYKAYASVRYCRDIIDKHIKEIEE